MKYVIRSNAEPYIYYTGNDWSADQNNARVYDDPVNAEVVIAQHNMDAAAVKAEPGPNDTVESLPEGE